MIVCMTINWAYAGAIAVLTDEGQLADFAIPSRAMLARWRNTLAGGLFNVRL